MPGLPPLIVQSDGSILLEVDNPLYEEARDSLARFASLEKSPEHFHTYRITPLSLWNAAAAGMPAEAMIDSLTRHGRYDLPDNVRLDILEYVSRYGRLSLVRENDDLLLICHDPSLMAQVTRQPELAPLIKEQRDQSTLVADPAQRGRLKWALVRLGYPAEDLAGYVEGAPLALRLLRVARSGQPFRLRRYQKDAVAHFHAGGAAHGGSGVITLPCGAGKTVVGMGVMEKLQTATLILTPSTVAARQWIDELLDKTSLQPEDIGEYSGQLKQLRPVTVTTYQILTYRPRRSEDFPHFDLFNREDWGLIIYDEVHLLPAPIFRITADIQARRRLGLTATLVREDAREEEVFSLIGPKKYDLPWRELEQQGWIAAADCSEIRIPLSDEERLAYAIAPMKDRYRIAAENPAKLPVLERLLEWHRGDSILIIGQYLDQLHRISKRLKAPLITGRSSVAERRQRFEDLRLKRLNILVVSKVANFSVDIPDVNVAIQVSGTFGSRQEEAQRLGRLLRPKSNGGKAYIYSLVSRDTRDQEFAAKRQLFLTEQGYRYTILYDDEICDEEGPATNLSERECP